MKIAAHRDKVKRLDAVRQRLDPLEDFELWFWMSLCGGTHALNAALHRAGVTDDGDYFCTQVADVYLAPGDGPGTWAPTIRIGGDVIHVGMPPIESALPPALDAACQAMQALEEVRDPCVRGDRPVTAEIVTAVEAAYRTCLGLTGQVLGPSDAVRR